MFVSLKVFFICVIIFIGLCLVVKIQDNDMSEGNKIFTGLLILLDIAIALGALIWTIVIL